MDIVCFTAKKTFTLLLTLLFSLTIYSQPIEVTYHNPLDRAISLSANFAELRPNHFHSGLDFRVGGAAGAKLYAVADGYVSRINVSPWGYGKAIYIDHPNGETSVYAHLDGFSEKLRKYIEGEQYNNQTFAIDKMVDSGAITIKKGEVIGYAGNSGSSFGAHLHFEIRKTHNQAPVNTVTRGIFKVDDKQAPTIHQLAVFTLDSTFTITTPRLLKNCNVIKKGNNYVPEGNEVFEVYNPVYFGIQANDYQPNNRSKFGVYRMTCYIDDVPFYGYQLDEFTFEETRYINSFIAYDELINSNRMYVKTFVEPGNILSVYKGVKNNGLIILNDTLLHKVRIVLYDDNENKTVLTFNIKKKNEPNPNTINLLNPEQHRPVQWDSSFVYENENLKVFIPEKSLYSNILFTCTNNKATKGLYAPIYDIGKPTIPLQKRMTISIKADSVPDRLKPKAIIVRKGKNNKFGSVGGTWDENNTYISSNVNEFGSYSIMVDTIAPKATVKFKKGADLKIQKTLTVTISDNLSGIATYNGYIDGKWALFDYDAKTRSLTYKFDATHIKKGTKHTLKMVVEDACKNSTTLNTEFVW